MDFKSYEFIINQFSFISSQNHRIKINVKNILIELFFSFRELKFEKYQIIFLKPKKFRIS